MNKAFIRCLLSAFFIACGLCVCAQDKAVLSETAAKYSLKRAQSNVLQEEESTKTLILKYASAEAAKKGEIKKEIEKKELAREEERIEKQKERIKNDDAGKT